LGQLFQEIFIFSLKKNKIPLFIKRKRGNIEYKDQSGIMVRAGLFQFYIYIFLDYFNVLILKIKYYYFNIFSNKNNKKYLPFVGY